ncbi:MAG: hypothetical protein VB095_11205 [Anaerovorax sp.]|nr:hypothetical protein [Anaerovorax sp.]
MSKITLKAMPFDSKEVHDPKTGVEVYDRVAYSKDLADWLRTYFSNGILVQGGDVLGSQMQVIHNVGMVCTIKAGGVCINGRSGWLEKDTEVTLKVGGALPRYDRIVAELNIPDDRGIYIKVLEGVSATEPEYPALTQTEDVYQIPLARIKIEADSAKIAEVIDERKDYISNVTIGIKPPTGMDAETVKVSDKTKNMYGVDNVDEALKNALAHLSYIAFCTNANRDSLDAAFGKNNEDKILMIGKQMAMYAWFMGDNKTVYPFANTIQIGKLRDIINDATSFEEIRNNETLYQLILSSPWAKNILDSAPPRELPRIDVFSNGQFAEGITHTDVSNRDGVFRISNNLINYGVYGSGGIDITLNVSALNLRGYRKMTVVYESPVEKYLHPTFFGVEIPLGSPEYTFDIYSKLNSKTKLTSFVFNWHASGYTNFTENIKEIYFSV